MKSLKVLKYPNEFLRKKTVNVRRETNWEEIERLSQMMHKTVKYLGAIGLSAPQVGVSFSMFVMNINGEELTFINPEILEKDTMESFLMREGCLSFPLNYGWVSRPKRVKVRFINLNKEIEERVFEDLESSCIQHEIDHLEGILFIDHMSRIQREMILKKINKTNTIHAF